MSLWNKILGEGKPKIVLPEPWGLYVGAAVQIDTLPIKLHTDLLMELPDPEKSGELILVALGVIDLEGKTVCRLYTENDTILQFLMTEDRVDEATLYVAYDAYYPDSEEQIDAWVGTRGKLGATEYELQGVRYRRLWDGSDAQHVTPIRYQEKIYTHRSPSLVDRVIQQTAMLYGRPLKADNAGEYLLATFEEHPDGTSLVSMMLGIDLDSSIVKIR